MAYCTSRGAEKVFDYSSEDVVEEIVAYLKGKKLGGIMDSVPHPDTIEKCVKIAQAPEGSKDISSIAPGTDAVHPGGAKVSAVFGEKEGLEEMKRVLYGEFLFEALAVGKMKAKPDPLIIGKGLEFALEACDMLKAGMSARKIVASLL